MYQPDSKARMLAYGPTGKVPVLVDGDVMVWESLAIIEYLAEKFPAKGRLAERCQGPRARAFRRQRDARWLPAAAPEVPDEPARKRFAYKDRGPEVADSVARLEACGARRARASAHGGPFLYGAFSAADAMYAPVVTRLDTYQIPVAAETRAYMDAILNHPAFSPGATRRCQSRGCSRTTRKARRRWRCSTRQREIVNA